MNNNLYTEKLFSYGTLQTEAVQLGTFGRKLHGTADILAEYELFYYEIPDVNVVALSGEAVHKMIRKTNNPTDVIHGMVFEISEQELLHADEYEVPDYKRIQVKLQSGINAWVYVSLD